MGNQPSRNIQEVGGTDVGTVALPVRILDAAGGIPLGTTTDALPESPMSAATVNARLLVLAQLLSTGPIVELLGQILNELMAHSYQQTDAFNLSTDPSAYRDMGAQDQ